MSSSNSSLSAQEAAIFNGPAGPPPEGVIPNFDNPSNKTAASYAVSAICTALTTFFVVIRIYAKAYCLRDVHVPDALALIAFGIYCGFVYALFDCIHDAGFLIDYWNYRLQDLPSYLYPNYLMAIFYSLAIAFLKSAILLDLCRIFTPLGIRNCFWWTSHVLVALNMAFYIAMFFGWTFSCSPVEKFWKPWVSGTCVYIDVLNGAFNLVTDLAILLLPQRVIWKLKLPTKKRIGVSTIFAIGFLACVITAIRMPYAIRMYLSNNLTYDLSALDLWGLGEMTCGFIVFCAPASLVTFSHLSNSTTLLALKSWFTSFKSKLRSFEGKSEEPWLSSAVMESNSRTGYHQINIDTDNALDDDRSSRIFA
ncbi:hypothetical protein F4818DRAFT_397411 [Hypoxylon cercidicola]|nr:hypothetical protein F4818DRAFT_397411 [Hypoxylon cercidicola]